MFFHLFGKSWAQIKTPPEIVCTKTVHWENPRIIRVFSLFTLAKYTNYQRILSVNIQSWCITSLKNSANPFQLMYEI